MLNINIIYTIQTYVEGDGDGLMKKVSDLVSTIL